MLYFVANPNGNVHGFIVCALFMIVHPLDMINIIVKFARCYKMLYCSKYNLQSNLINLKIKRQEVLFQNIEFDLYGG